MIATAAMPASIREPIANHEAYQKGIPPLRVTLQSRWYYSRSRDRLAAIQLFTEFHDGSPVLTERELDKGIHLHPGFPGRVAAMLPKAADESVMERIALAQWKVQDQFSLPLCIGGCMRLFDVTSGGASERIIGTYPDYATHAQRFGDPNAALVMELTEGARAA